MTKSRHLLISGKVQGVGFRRHVETLAHQFGVSGWTRNLLDGRVEVLASGKDKTLLEFIRFVKMGPRFSRVESLVERDVDAAFAELTTENFRVLPDEEHPWSE